MERHSEKQTTSRYTTTRAPPSVVVLGACQFHTSQPLAYESRRWAWLIDHSISLLRPGVSTSTGAERNITFSALQRLEQGSFQKLGDELLPTEYGELECLRPHGVNAEGKTRKGVPDS